MVPPNCLKVSIEKNLSQIENLTIGRVFILKARSDIPLSRMEEWKQWLNAARVDERKRMLEKLGVVEEV